MYQAAAKNIGPYNPLQSTAGLSTPQTYWTQQTADYGDKYHHTLIQLGSLDAQEPQLYSHTYIFM